MLRNSAATFGYAIMGKSVRPGATVRSLGECWRRRSNAPFAAVSLKYRIMLEGVVKAKSSEAAPSRLA